MDDNTIRAACSMRLEGKSWEAISQLLHYDRSYLSRAVGRALRRRQGQGRPEAPVRPMAYSSPDLQQLPALAYCAQCGLEIYPGQAAWTDGQTLGDLGNVDLHEDCLMDWVKELGTANVADAFGFRRGE